MKHGEDNKWPKSAYNVVKVGNIWFRSAPNFRQIIKVMDTKDEGKQ